mmetsp:Transcript_86068/g.230365  ORF Transcript_86068/g.230365 Transcript_86068/m.230365 type:complete len:251 (-) Transcript_86068:9-761(-)
MDCSRKYTAVENFVLESPAAEIAARVMGCPRVAFFYDFLFVKEPGTQDRTPWHQDLGYWSVQGTEICSVWTPLEDLPKEASMEFVVRGGMPAELRERDLAPVRFATGQVYEGAEHMPRVPEVEADRAMWRVVSWDTKVGDCIVFRADVLHAAAANQTPGRRRALSTRWLGPDARFAVSSKCVETRRSGYPNFPVSLQDGQQVVDSGCPAFPVLWPREARGQLRSPGALVPFPGYGAERQAQGQMYSRDHA